MSVRLASPSRRFSFAVALSLAAAPLSAQESEPAASEGTAAESRTADRQPGIEEIIVTSTKREENIQDVPIAVTALSGLDVERAGVKDLRDLPTLSPSFNLNSAQTESQGTTLRVRGVGTTGNNIGLESAVGVFLDGVYLSRPGVALGDLVDVAQIEVLRGPQGTLFGRNTSAGALHIKTKKPDLAESEYWANASIGNFDAYNVQAGLSVPILEDQLGFRFSGAWRDQDGFVESSTGAESGTRDRYSLRGQLYWAPTEDIDLRVIGDYAEAKEECCDAAISFESPLVAAGAFAAAGLPANGGVTRSGRSAVENRRSNAEQFENPFEQWGVSSELNWELGPASLTYLIAYRDFRADSVQHADFVSLDVFSVPGDTGFGTFDDIETLSHELRLQGEAGRVDWLVGFYYSDEDIAELASLQLGTDYGAYTSAAAFFGGIFPLVGASLDAVPLPLGGTFGDVRTSPNPAVAFAGGVDPAGSFAANLFRQESKSWSIFTHNTVHVTERLDAVVGLRFIDEKKDGSFDQLAASSPACLNTLANAAGLPSAAAAVGAFAVGFACFPFAAQADVPGTPLPATFGGRFEDDELTYTLALAYAFTDDFRAYASYSHGFKAGGFNLDATAAATGADPRFDSETTNAYEIGVKSVLFDNRVRANLAVFHQDIDDFQVLEFTGIRFQTFNVPNARSTGAELELAANPLESLSLTAALTFADARYPSGCDRGGPPAPQISALCGQQLTNAPKWASVLGATYDGQVPGTELTYFLSSSLRIESDRRTSTQHIDPTSGVPLLDDIQEENTKVNLRAGIGGEDGHWTLEIWGNNVFDKQTKNVTFNVPLRGVSSIGTASRGVFLEAPRTYGATLRLAF